VKVVQVAPRYPPQTGGVETHVGQVSRRLVERGHEVAVHTADAREDGRRRERRDGVRVVRHPGVAPDGAFHVAPGIAPAVRRASADADVVHAHNYHSLPLLLAGVGVAAPVVGSGTPLVATPHYHGGSADATRNRLLRAYRPVGGWALDRAAAVLAVSEWERDRLAADFGVPATVVPNGIDVGRFADADPHRRERPYLLTVGRLERYKGVQHAVRALADLPEYDLLVAGSGDYRADLERLAVRAGVADRVEFLGYVPDEDLPGLYAGAAAHVTVSAFEAFGLTVGEALAAGTPCVVGRAGALAEWADREDCVGADPTGIPEAVRSAVGREAPSDPLPTWDDAADGVVAAYDRVVDG
jgi:glycosyltransferase involved in cell wall biosynthesis